MSASPLNVLLAIAIIALGFLVVAAFYESLATRDIYVGRAIRAARRRTSKPLAIGLVYGTRRSGAAAASRATSACGGPSGLPSATRCGASSRRPRPRIGS
jgi:hypothetical protein